jgi:DNA-binding transcriptional regulator YiaG
MKPIECMTEPVITADDISEYRSAIGMTQEEFADFFQIPIGTLRRWEQGQSKPAISMAKLTVCNRVIKWMKNRSEAAL